MRRGRTSFWKGDCKIIGLILVILGISIVGLLLFPYKLWLIIIGLMLIFVGYRLFC